MKIAVLGAGSWGTALAMVLADNQNDINLWSFELEHVEKMRETRRNSQFLEDAYLDPERISIYHDIKACVKEVELVLIAVPSQVVRNVMKSLGDAIKTEQILVNVAKGIEMDTLKRMSEVVGEYFPENTYVILSGPSHAEEVAKKLPTTLVSASRSRVAAEMIQDLFTTDYLRIYTNPDVVGVELCGSLKNIIAIGAGITDGMGFGDNAKAALMTRGITEIARLGMVMGARTETFAGLSGIGDLIVTCTSMHSRNRRCGIQIGKGKTLDEAIASLGGMVVEGVYTTKSAYELSKKYEVDMPITGELYAVLYEGKDARESVKNLMIRNQKHEIEALFDDEEWA